MLAAVLVYYSFVGVIAVPVRLPGFQMSGAGSPSTHDQGVLPKVELDDLLDADFDDLIGDSPQGAVVKNEVKQVVKSEVKKEDDTTPVKRRRTSGQFVAGSSRESLASSHGVAELSEFDSPGVCPPRPRSRRLA